MSAETRYAGNFRELIVYGKARGIARDIYDVTKRFPKEGLYSPTDQVRRSSRSIGAQIAEAWGKRRYERHFVTKLTDADAEQLETQHWLETAWDCGYITESEKDSVCDQLREIGRMLNSMMDKSGSFCDPGRPMVREEPAEYFVDDN